MGAAGLLDHLRASGFTMRAEGCKLLVAPAAGLTDADRAAIRQHRDALLVALRVATALERPYGPSTAEADAAHCPAWDDSACTRFAARVSRMHRLGINATDADALAERLHVRDREQDDRVSCTDCRHYRPGRCRNHRAAGMYSPELGRDLAVMLQRCPGFTSACSRTQAAPAMDMLS